MSQLGTTRKAARAAGISLATLQRWIAAGKVSAPRLRIRHGRAVRLWTARDVEQLRRYKAAHYRKGRGRKKKRA
jgi:predicted site-specific integrase-resolvase